MPVIPPAADLPAAIGRGEAWWFDAVSDDAALAVAVCVGRRAGTGRGWYWAVVAGPDRTTVSVVDHDLELSASGPPLELRAPGLWADHNASAPGGHWSVAAEAFGVALDNPWDAWGRGFGDPTPVGLDLEWDPVTPPVVLDGDLDAGAGAWSVGCEVHGEVLVGPERLEFAGRGSRGRWWGDRGWPAAGELERSGWTTEGWAHDVDQATSPAAGPTDHRGTTVEAWFERFVAPSVGVGLPVAWAPVLDGWRPDGVPDRLALAVVAEPGDGGGWRGWVRWRPGSGAGPGGSA